MGKDGSVKQRGRGLADCGPWAGASPERRLEHGLERWHCSPSLALWRPDLENEALRKDRQVTLVQMGPDAGGQMQELMEL